MMGDGLSLGLCLPGAAGCDDHAKFLLGLSKWLDDDPKFHGSLGCGCPIAKINSQSMLTTRYMPSCPTLALSTFCHAPALLHCSRGWGEG